MWNLASVLRTFHLLGLRVKQDKAQFRKLRVLCQALCRALVSVVSVQWIVHTHCTLTHLSEPLVASNQFTCYSVQQNSQCWIQKRFKSGHDLGVAALTTGCRGCISSRFAETIPSASGVQRSCQDTCGNCRKNTKAFDFDLVGKVAVFC